MSKIRNPGRGSGGYGTASDFGNIDGWSFTDAHAYLSNHSDLRRWTVATHGYHEYIFNDSSKVWIRPSGEVIRVPHPMYDAEFRQVKGYRINIRSGLLLRSPVWHTLPRNTQEWVIV